MPRRRGVARARTGSEIRRDRQRETKGVKRKGKGRQRIPGKKNSKWAAGRGERNGDRTRWSD